VAPIMCFTPVMLKKSNFKPDLVSFGHYVVCPLIYRFWLPLWYLLVIMLFVLWFTDSDYPFGIFWSLCCLSFDLQILITSLVSFGHYVESKDKQHNDQKIPKR
jgi:hypothetical protein